MTNYYEVTAIREYTDRNGEIRKSYTRLGTAFPHKQGGGFSVVLDAIPAPVEGQFKFNLFVPKPKDNQGGGYQTRDDGPGNNLDDEIPW